MVFEASVLAALLAFVVSGCSSGDTAGNASAPGPTSAPSGAGGATVIETTSTGGGISTGGAASSTTVPFAVAPEATVCKQDLLFKVPGCGCQPGTPDQACWTGPPADRHVDHCKDGVQKCVGKELAQWGPCEGETLLCHYPPEHLDAGKPDAGKSDSGTPPPPPPCSCQPGATIGCDEDCQTLVICSLTGYKTCQPDGTWAPCRETSDLNILNNLLGCRNWLHGCLPGADDGVFTGDCSTAFTCGHPPGTVATPPP